MKDKDEFKYHVVEDHPFDEVGSTFSTLRKIQWGIGQDEEPDPNKVKLENRNWRLQDNKEICKKGFTFMTEEGPHALTNTLVENGYGRTKDVLKLLSERDDFRESVETLYSDDSVREGDYFDPRSLLLPSEEE